MRANIDFEIGASGDDFECPAGLLAASALPDEEIAALGSILNHDVRSPIGVVQGYAHVLDRSDGARLSERGRHYLQRMQAAADQLDAMVAGLAFVAKLSGAQVRRQPLDLARIAVSCLDELKNSAGQRAVQCEVNGPLWCQADHELMSTALRHLLGNAWKFTRFTSAARIEVGMEAGPCGEPWFHVRDNGCGVEPADVPKLFIPFRRLRPDEYEGVGIGLACVAKIIGLHGGRVAIAGQPEGGTVVHFCVGRQGCAGAPWAGPH